MRVQSNGVSDLFICQIVTSLVCLISLPRVCITSRTLLLNMECIINYIWELHAYDTKNYYPFTKEVVHKKEAKISSIKELRSPSAFHEHNASK